MASVRLLNLYDEGDKRYIPWEIENRTWTYCYKAFCFIHRKNTTSRQSKKNWKK